VGIGTGNEVARVLSRRLCQAGRFLSHHSLIKMSNTATLSTAHLPLTRSLPDLVTLIEIEGIQWLETATCERGFSLRTQFLTAQRYSMGDSLLACLMMICSNGPSLDQKEEVEKCLLATVARFKAFTKRMPLKARLSKRPQRASASKAKSSVLSELSGLENVLFNDFVRFHRR